MRRRQHQDTVRGVKSTAIGLERLSRELSASPSPEASSESDATGQPEVFRRISYVIGRQLVDETSLAMIEKSFLNMPGFRYRPYRPTVIYASEKFLREAMEVPDYEVRASAYVEEAKKTAPYMEETAEVTIKGLKTWFLDHGRVSFSLKLEQSAAVSRLAHERTLLRRSLTGGEAEERGLKPLVVNLGTLSLSDSMRRVSREDLESDIPIPDTLVLAPVDVVRL